MEVADLKAELEAEDLSKVIKFQYIMGALIFFAGQSAYSQFLAEFLYKNINGVCPKRVTSIVSILTSLDQFVCSNYSSPQFRVNVVKNATEEFANSAYLASLAAGRSQQLGCTNKQMLLLEKNSKNMEDFLDDYEAKIRLIGFEKRKMSEIKKLHSKDKSSLKEYEDAQIRSAATLDSMPYTEIAPLRHLISHIVSEYENHDPKSLESWMPAHTKALLRKALKNAHVQIQNNKEVMDKGVETMGQSLDTYSRESLAQDSELVEAYAREHHDIKFELEPTICSVNAKYGQGAKYRDRALFAISLLGSGSTLMLTKMASVGTAVTAVEVISIGSHSIKVAGLLRMLVAAGATTTALTQIHRACLAQEVEAIGKTSLDSSDMTCEENILVSESEKNCMLISLLNIFGLYTTIRSANQAVSKIKVRGRAN